MITPESIDRVRESADIVEIVGEHVKLKRAGGDFRGPCPFHGGKNPNFSVSPKRNAYHCFKCGVSGDAIGFVREHLGLDFVEAVRYVAARAGVDVQETRAPRDAGEQDPREPLWEAMSAASELFRASLWDDVEAQPAREYLASRGLEREQARPFRVGLRAARRRVGRAPAGAGARRRAAAGGRAAECTRRRQPAARALSRPAHVPDPRHEPARRRLRRARAGRGRAEVSQLAAGDPVRQGAAAVCAVVGAASHPQAGARAGRRRLLRRDPPRARGRRGDGRAAWAPR